MSKKKLILKQSEHTVALSGGNMATRRRPPSPSERPPETPRPAVNMGPALIASELPQRKLVLPEQPPIPSVLIEVVQPPAKAPKPSRPRRASGEAARARAPKAGAPQPSSAKSSTPAVASDPLLQRMPMGSPSRARMISLRARNAQLRQQIEQLALNSKARSRA
jgi:hypothetical protein